MTPEQIAEGRRLLDAATPGPWKFTDTSDHRGNKGEFRAPSPYNGLMLVGPWCNEDDPELIVWARNNLPALLDALDDAECESERLRGDWIIEDRQRKAVEAALTQARATNARLNRRCQQAEKAARENIDACQRAGVSFGRSLANYGAMLYLEDLERARATIARVLKLIDEAEQSPSRGVQFGGTPFPAVVGADQLRAVLDGDQ
ncbi:hypothetical protein KI427_16720 [Rhodococcus ruber]|uniref:hypothetical protein n=1 Tax=Rhodococcus ruber TaxID=1830 RepID=UPI000743CB53|nr:hypothetical protein [Rhodococcus ruber]UQB71261.1 hypothetical protein KI427_16720 [Rhodococcus ruber]